MIKISAWARKNIHLARLLLIVCFILLYIIGAWLGDQFAASGIRMNGLFLYATLIVFAVFYIYYPSRKQKKILTRPFYLRKVYQARFGLTVCLFALLLFAGNRPEKVNTRLFNEAWAILPAKDSPSIKYWPITEFKAMMKDANGKKLKLKERKRLLKQQLIRIQHSSTTDGEKALLIALSILVALGALAGIAAISCSLACNDMGGLAIFVLLGGTTLVVFGLIKIIRRITKGPQLDN